MEPALGVWVVVVVVVVSISGVGFDVLEPGDDRCW